MTIIIVYIVVVFAHPSSSSSSSNGVLRVFSEGRNVNPGGLVEAAHRGVSASLRQVRTEAPDGLTDWLTDGGAASRMRRSSSPPPFLPHVRHLWLRETRRGSLTLSHERPRGEADTWEQRALSTDVKSLLSQLPRADRQLSRSAEWGGGTWVNFMVRLSYRLAQSACCCCCCCCGNPVPALWGAHWQWTPRGKSGKVFTEWKLEASSHS